MLRGYFILRRPIPRPDTTGGGLARGGAMVRGLELPAMVFLGKEFFSVTACTGAMSHLGRAWNTPALIRQISLVSAGILRPVPSEPPSLLS